MRVVGRRGRQRFMHDTATTRRMIEAEIGSNHVVLFMKGSKVSPKCGFSARVSAILEELGVRYKDIDVLADPALRDEIKAFSQWPTIPQLYVGGRFVGGCDIVSDLYASGELQQLLGVHAHEAEPPSITITDRAANELRGLQLSEREALRLEIDPQLQFDLLVEVSRPDDVKLSDKGITLRLSPASAKRAGDLLLDFVEDGVRAGFKIQRQQGVAARSPSGG